MHAHAAYRLIKSARVLDGQICYDIKDANQIYELFYTRFSLHKRIYNHKTSMSLSPRVVFHSSRYAAKAIEYMVVDALLAAEPYLKFAKSIEDPKRYVYLTDHLLNKIEESTEKVRSSLHISPPADATQELESARAIIERIHMRDLYRVVDWKVFSHKDRKMIEEKVTPETIVAVAKSGVLTGVDEELVAQLQPCHLAVMCSLLHYGQGEKNPLGKVTFYSKKRPHGA